MTIACSSVDPSPPVKRIDVPGRLEGRLPPGALPAGAAFSGASTFGGGGDAAGSAEEDGGGGAMSKAGVCDCGVAAPPQPALSADRTTAKSVPISSDRDRCMQGPPEDDDPGEVAR